MNETNEKELKGTEEENKNLKEETDEEEKKPKEERTGILNIYTTKNNTILTVTDITGNTISRASGGQSTKQSRLKSSPTIAMFSAKKVSEEMKELGITDLYVRVRGKTGSTSQGSSSFAVIKTLTRDGFKILNIIDITKQPRGGPKPKGGRRGRRV